MRAALGKSEESSLPAEGRLRCTQDDEWKNAQGREQNQRQLRPPKRQAAATTSKANATAPSKSWPLQSHRQQQGAGGTPALREMATARRRYSASCMDLKSASRAAQYCFWASSSAWSFFTSSSRRRISWRSFWVSADGGAAVAAARCGGAAGRGAAGAVRCGANVCAGSVGHADVVAGAALGDATCGCAPF
jgi:hypothetical protein